MTDLRHRLSDLETAEDFLEFFDIPYEQRIVDRCRLHILQRAHDYLRTSEGAHAAEDDLYARFRTMLDQAYRDFAGSDPLTERVFKVLKQAAVDRPEERTPFVPLDAVFRSSRSER